MKHFKHEYTMATQLSVNPLEEVNGFPVRPGLFDVNGAMALPIGVNFLTCHDGFTLYDLYSYNEKHNEANGWNNTDGANDNRSWNCGWEDVRITLPNLNNQGAWYLSVNTYGDGNGQYCYPEGQEQRIYGEFIMRPRSVAIFTGKDK